MVKIYFLDIWLQGYFNFCIELICHSTSLIRLIDLKQCNQQLSLYNAIFIILEKESLTDLLFWENKVHTCSRQAKKKMSFTNQDRKEINVYMFTNVNKSS